MIVRRYPKLIVEHYIQLIVGLYPILLFFFTAS